AIFSLTIRWPSAWLICSATSRAITSDVPPAANGTITVIARLGDMSSAYDGTTNASVAATVTANFISAMSFRHEISGLEYCCAKESFFLSHSAWRVQRGPDHPRRQGC